MLLPEILICWYDQCRYNLSFVFESQMKFNLKKNQRLEIIIKYNAAISKGKQAHFQQHLNYICFYLPTKSYGPLPWVLCYVSQRHNIIHALTTRSNTVAVCVLVFALPKLSAQV